jgi:hypothetical protein
MKPLDQWDTGYRSQDWAKRPKSDRRLDYHDIRVQLVAEQLRGAILKLCRDQRDAGHEFDHARNVLVLLIREFAEAYRNATRQDAGLRLRLRPSEPSLSRGTDSRVSQRQAGNG